MAFLSIICFLAFIALGIVGIVSAIRKVPSTKRVLLLSFLSLVLMVVFASLAGGNGSGDTTKAVNTATNNSSNNHNKSVNTNNKQADTAQADADAVTANRAEAQKKAESEAKIQAEAKAKEETKAKTEAAEKARQKAALSQLVKHVDEVEGITWYQDKAAPKYINENGIYAYFGVKDDKVVSGLHLKIQYTGKSWIFIKNYVFNMDGEKYEINPGFMGAERDMSTDINSPGVWEYHDETLDSTGFQLLNAMINSQKTIMRLDGDQRQKDVTISANQKAALKRVLDAYTAAGGKS
jgi:flagellar biosynthesis GTPase FlhF